MSLQLFGRNAVILLAFIVLGMSLALAATHSSATAEPIGEPKTAFERLTAEQTQQAMLATRQAPNHRDRTDLQRSEVLSLVEDIFGDQLQTVPDLLLNPESVNRYLGTNAAIVSQGEGRSPVLYESSSPLRIGPDREPIDLSLQRTADSFKPASPLVEVTLPEESNGHIGLGDTGVTLVADPSRDGEVGSKLQEGTVLYPNIEENKDLAITPTMGGIETFTVIRDESSSHRDEYEFDLPPGATIELLEDGSAIITRNGETLLTVSKPVALDATLKQVPVVMSLEENTLVLETSPEPNTKYPILVDPTIEIYLWANSLGMVGLPSWRPTYQHAPPSPSFALRKECVMWLWCYSPSGVSRPGLYIDAFANTYGTASAATWNYFVPRYHADISSTGAPPSTFITYMSYATIYRLLRTDTGGNPAMVAGLYAPQSNYWGSIGGYTTEINNGSITMEPGGTPAQLKQVKQAVFGEWVFFEGRKTTDYRNSYVGSIAYALDDQEAPGIGAVSPPSSWVDDEPAPIGITVSDPGLGVKKLTLRSEDGSQTWTTNVGCTGLTHDPCPRTWSSSIGQPVLYDPEELPTGINDIEIRAFDTLGKTDAGTAEVKVDHEDPEIDVAGTVAEAEGTAHPFSDYSVALNVSDGSPGDRQSGIASYSIKLDGATVESRVVDCIEDSCGAGTSWSASAAELGVGTHDIEIEAVDNVGRDTTDSFEWTVPNDTINPALGLDGEFMDEIATEVDPSRYSLDVAATDGGFGVRYVEVTVDGEPVANLGEPCDLGGCSLNKTVEVDLRDLSAGPHDLKVTAIDGFGNETEETEAFSVADVASPAVSLSGPLADAEGNWIEQGIYPLSLSVADAELWGTRLEIRVDGNLLQTEYPCSPSCSVDHELDLNLSTIAVGTHELSVVAVDSNNHERVSSISFNVTSSGTLSSPGAISVLDGAAPDLTSPDQGLSQAPEAQTEFELQGDEFVTQNAPVTSSVSENPEEGFEIETVNGTTVGAESSEAPPNSPSPAVAQDASLVFGTTATATDMVTKPVYNGILDFRQIRSSSAAEDYEWSVQLASGQTLAQVNSRVVEVRYASGKRAITIVAPSVVDGAGTELASTLTASGTDITLHIEHQVSGVIYPVVAGTAWTAAYDTKVASRSFFNTEGTPGVDYPPEAEVADETEVEISAPYVSAVDVTASKGRSYNAKVDALAKSCSKHAGCGLWEVKLKTRWWVKTPNPRPIMAWYGQGSFARCWIVSGLGTDIDILGDGFYKNGPNPALQSKNQHLKSWCRMKAKTAWCLPVAGCAPSTTKTALWGHRLFPSASADVWMDSDGG